MITQKRTPLPWEGLGPVVPVPAVYIDEIMPALTDTEWRVLLVIIRQTLGWIDQRNSETRKERDWLTHSQLKLRTGKSGDSISRSVESLVRFGLIVVESEEGAHLSSANARKCARTRLYYRVGEIPTSVVRTNI